MVKLVVLKIDGDLEYQGFRVTLEIGSEFARPEIEISGKLPADPDLATCLNQWQKKYRRLGMPSRIKPQEIIYDGSINTRISECSQRGRILSDRLQKWLDSEEFRPINNTLREELKRDETIRVLIRTDNNDLHYIPWHLWDFFNKYSFAEFAITATASETPPKPPRKPKVRILAILGNSRGIDVQLDRQLLENLPNSETVFLVEPQRKELNNYLWQQWDIFFFAGHSETANDIGHIYINKTDSLSIEELKYGLKRAIEQGLQLAIFNSCDGLGLARQLASLNIPQMIVMRQPVPDEVAQEFLKSFLKAFSGGHSLYQALREAREKLQGLEDKYPNATWLPVLFQNPRVVPLTWRELSTPKIESKRHFMSVLMVSVFVTASIMGVRYLGMLQPWELRAYDHLMQLRPATESSDSRLLIVTVDEADIHYQNQQGMKGRGSLSDKALTQLLQKLERYQPTTIGIDIYRDFSVDPNYPDLMTRLKRDNRIFAVCKVPADFDGAPDGIHPPYEVPIERQTFSDLVADEDEVARRQLLYLTPPAKSPCTAEYAFSLQLARHYLRDKGIKANITPEGYLQIGKVLLKPIKEHTSGYQQINARGYQVLLNYRSLGNQEKIADSISLKDVLNDHDHINPELLKNRIVLIGVTAPSTADYWRTPLNNKKVPGVFVQAQMIGHILSAVENQRPLLWWWSWWVETLWMWGWSLVGGIIAWRCSKSLYLGLAVAGALLTLFGICFGIFTQAGWIPLVPPALALILTAMAVVLRIKK
ncbi:transmembrane sensor domain-containing protein [Scytonema hofmannii PCC 7110]|uniref:Transmembrane sensor domain-containing protein n=1 Tax=Scytonema hofmannii PCC 7110 TaxID=128403 RepID=A0A139X7R4_9CYAN|nr:CHASE2 domain-containing protein [Scytonema hofmannii]KYC40672.1 transmembrane sensor domain-containing protein [Scytonema hofmannii PCC 7110]